MALAQAADEEPSLRSLFRELADGIVSRLRQLLENLHLDATYEQAKLIHSLSVGLAVVDLGTQRPPANGEWKQFLKACLPRWVRKAGRNNYHRRFLSPQASIALK